MLLPKMQSILSRNLEKSKIVDRIFASVKALFSSPDLSGQGTFFAQIACCFSFVSGLLGTTVKASKRKLQGSSVFEALKRAPPPLKLIIKMQIEIFSGKL